MSLQLYLIDFFREPGSRITHYQALGVIIRRSVNAVNERTLTNASPVAGLVPVLAVVLTACGDARGPLLAVPPLPPAKITQFYSSTPKVSKGDEATICYGVQNALAVRLEPPVEDLHPTLARCFQFQPAGRTKYTLVARGKGGEEVAQSLFLQLVGPRPTFVDLKINAQEVKAGEVVSFCFTAQNATSVRGGPGRFVKGGVPTADCLHDRPAATTTYWLTIGGAGGMTDSDQITVRVKGN